MGLATREQRWLQWRNTDSTTCPPFGCVELQGYESSGRNVVMKGESASAFGRDPNVRITEIDGEIIASYAEHRQGAQWNHVFNNDLAVAPGDIGLCTFDLPTWAAISNPHNFPVSPGTLVTLGQFFDRQKANSVIGPDEHGNFQILGTPAAVQVGEPWKLGLLISIFMQETSLVVDNQCAWNAYCGDPNAYLGSPGGLFPGTKAYIGGTRTWHYGKPGPF